MELPTRMSERFTLAEPIGRGTCSTVFRARDELLDRDVAVKVFPVTDDPRVAREVHLLASLDHPALVPVYDLGEVDGRAYVVMALFEGGNLADRLAAGGPLPLGQALLSAAAVADALAHVHRAGVLHRDVIPRNVLFDADGRAHLSDFGVALVADAPRITDTGIVVGSAPYLAPEQVRGGTVGPTADVYSLGLVTIEALTARPAYEGTPLEAAQARLEHPPAIPPGLPAEITELISGMTADDPADRPDAETVCRRMRQVALAQEIAPDDPRTAVGVVATDLTAITPRRVGAGRRAGRGTLVLGAATLSIMLASGVVIAATGPVGSVAATTPPGAGLAAPTVAAPAAPFAIGPVDDEASGSSDDSDSGSSDSSGDDDRSASSDTASDPASDTGSDSGSTVVADAPRAAAADDTDAETRVAVRPAEPRPDVELAEPAEPAGPTTETETPRPTTSSSSPSSTPKSTPKPTTTTTPKPTGSSTSPTSAADEKDRGDRSDRGEGGRDDEVREVEDGRDRSGDDGTPRRTGLLEALAGGTGLLGR